MIDCVRSCVSAHDGGSLVAVFLALVALLPSIVTALSAYPKAQGFLGSVSGILDRLSVLTHHNAPGTLKAPLSRSENPHGGTPDGDPNPNDES